MIIALVVGHSRLKNGNITSADGTKQGGVNEYLYNKELATYVVKYLKQLDCDVSLIICPEKQFTKSTEESTYKLTLINKVGYDLVVELHLNASDNKDSKGCEVLYISDNGKVYAERVQNKIATVFQDRDIKKRDNLYMLTRTKPVTIMLETFFCTSSTDCKLGADIDKIGKLIAEGIVGKDLPRQNKTFKIQVGAYNSKINAENMKARLEKAGFDAVIVEQ